MHPCFFKLKEQIFLNQWQLADPYTQQVLYWLPELKKDFGQTFCFFNLQWPDDNVISTIPKNMDTYVLHFGSEYVDWRWLNLFCKTFPTRRVVLISPYNCALYAEPNLILIQFEFWPHILKWYQKETVMPIPQFETKTKKISALANRVSQFRAYVCAYLHQNWDNEDYIISWQGVVNKQKDLYLLNPTGNNKIDSIIDYIKSTFFDLKIKPTSDFINNPLDNLFYDWSAYTDCVINCSNESINNSFQQTDQVSHIVPGPYLTEKTWKCLLSGTSLLPVGQYKTYDSLSKHGFKFDYPWDCKFDQLSGDIDRICEILNCLDQIKNMPLDFLKLSTNESNQHNRDYILSGNYFEQRNLVNLNNIENFIKTVQ